MALPGGSGTRFLSIPACFMQDTHPLKSEFHSVNSALPAPTLLVAASVTRKEENRNSCQRESFVLVSVRPFSIQIELVGWIAFRQLLREFNFLQKGSNKQRSPL